MTIHRFRPVEEEVRGFGAQMLFIILWYSTIAGEILRGKFNTNYLIFLVAGLLPVFSLIRFSQSAYSYRQQRREAIRLGNASPGRIINVIRKTESQGDGRNNRTYMHYYYLTVEIMNPETGIAMEFESSAYRIPVHRYLASPYVRVYTDETGWKHYIEGFQFKKNKHEPDILGDNGELDDGSFMGTKIIQTIIFVMIVLSFVSRIF